MKLSLILMAVATVLTIHITANAQGKNLLLLTAPDCDAKLASRVEKFCADELGLPVQLKPMAEGVDLAWPELAKKIQGNMAKTDLAVVLLASRAVSSNSVAMVSNMPVAVVVLTDPRKDGKAADETYARWIERETMRAYGLVLGVKICPNPQCAMSNYKVKPESLAALGRNYCPYCKKCLKDQLKAKGIVFPELKRVKKTEK
jgi:hypothetical protein